MLNAEIKKELDVLVGAIDERIDKKIDEREVETQKSVFNQTSKVDFQKKLANAIDKNKGYREWELKADELFVSEATGTYVQPQYEVGIKGTPFVSDLRYYCRVQLIPIQSQLIVGYIMQIMVQLF